MAERQRHGWEETFKGSIREPRVHEAACLKQREKEEKERGSFSELIQERRQVPGAL